MMLFSSFGVTPARRLLTLTNALLLSLSITSCSRTTNDSTSSAHITASLPADDPFDPPSTQQVVATQAWSDADRDWFYTTTQGSQLLPYQLFLHLENATDTQLFRSAENMNRWRYLPQSASVNNPDGLPIGWVKDSGESGDFIGLTCAACHTAQLQVNHHRIIVDGGAGQADMVSMLLALEAALVAPLNDPAKLSRLAKRLTLNSTELSVLLQHQATQLQFYNSSNAPLHTINGKTAEVPYGYARLDAFGRIFNRILNHLTPANPSNANPANAPVSYPVLWDTPQSDFVQWNGVGDNAANGALGRNTGEVLGVFAAMDLRVDPALPGFTSSAKLPELLAMETAIAKLQSPQWQELAERGILPAIDPALARRGAEVFDAYECGACHQPIDRADSQRRPLAQFYGLGLIGTDPLMATNALQYQGQSGYFEGQPINTQSLSTFGPITPVLPALSHATEGVIIRALADATPATGLSGTGQGTDTPNPRHLNFEAIDKKLPQGLLAYKARPLNGIWSSAPYLHNGSVPNLYSLFLPSCDNTDASPSCRPTSFSVGSRQLDTRQVGFVDLDPKLAPGIFVFDTRLPGNSNRGHEFTSGRTPMILRDAEGRAQRHADGSFITKTFPAISESDRWALVEYLKTL